MAQGANQFRRTSEKALSRGLLDVLIRAGLVAVLAISCYQIFRPFLDLILWSLILAVTLYPLQGRSRACWVTRRVAPQR